MIDVSLGERRVVRHAQGAIVDRLNDLIARMMQDPAVQKGLAARLVQPMPAGRKNFEELVRNECAHWKKRVPELGIQQE